MDEAGHFSMSHGAADIVVKKGGRPTICRQVHSIDPRFEKQSIPPVQGSKYPKFIGNEPFSLPILAPTKWVVSDERFGPLGGRGELSHQPVGYQIPANWADFANINGQSAEVDPEAPENGAFGAFKTKFAPVRKRRR